VPVAVDAPAVNGVVHGPNVVSGRPPADPIPSHGPPSPWQQHLK